MRRAALVATASPRPLPFGLRRETLGLWLGLLGVAIFAVTLPMTRLATGTHAFTVAARLIRTSAGTVAEEPAGGTKSATASRYPRRSVRTSCANWPWPVKTCNAPSTGAISAQSSCGPLTW